MLHPAPLRLGDTIAIITPASPVKEEYIDGAVRELKQHGYDVIVMPHAKGPACGTYAASAQSRIADFIDAWRNPDVKAVWCARGGYGCVDILDFILSDVNMRFIADNPKWLIGFSDITALHSLLSKAGIRSLHAPMAKDLTLIPDDESITKTFEILEGAKETVYKFPSSGYNQAGSTEGILIGGNLATLHGLGGTPFDLMSSGQNETEGHILFIEDVGENIYEINRMLFRLRMAGTLDKLKGMIIGQFTDYGPDRTYTTMEEMIHAMIHRWGIRMPVAFGFPAGHIDSNLPLIIGSRAHLDVHTDGVSTLILR